MNHSTIVSKVHAVDHRGITTNNKSMSHDPVDKVAVGTQKPYDQGIKGNFDKSRRGNSTGFCENMREFASGVMRPETGLVGEKLYETSFSQTMENLSKKYTGALTGFNDRVHGFAFGIMRPETGLIGEKTYDSSNSMTLENLSKEHIGAAAGIRNTLREYVKAAVESAGPPVAVFVKPINILRHQTPKTSAADIPQDTQHVNMVV